mgnify:CR=1 FL=1
MLIRSILAVVLVELLFLMALLGLLLLIAAGVLVALVVGDQGAIERSDWDLFRNTGVAHLMAISGLHITMFAWLAAALLGQRQADQTARLYRHKGDR